MDVDPPYLRLLACKSEAVTLPASQGFYVQSGAIPINDSVYPWASRKHLINFRNCYEQLNSERRRLSNETHLPPKSLIRVTFPEKEDVGGRGACPTCSEAWPNAEPPSPPSVKNERPASNETSACGLNSGKQALSGEMSALSA